MPDPMWRRIAESLRQKIEDGQLGADGRALPSELELREEYDASRNTVRDAVKWLVARGLVETRPGQGTFVVDEIDPFVTLLSPELEAGLGGETAAYLSEVTARRRRPRNSTPQVKIESADSLVASELRVPLGTDVVSRQQERFIDGKPYSLQTSFYRQELVRRGASRLIEASDIAEGGVAYLESTLPVKRAGRRDRYTASVPDSRESAFFALPDDGRVAIFKIIQTIYDEQGTPFVLTVTTYPADRNEFVMTAGQVPNEAVDDS